MEENTVLLANNLMKILSITIVSGVICARLSKLIKLPDVVLFIVAGILLGPQGLNLIGFESYSVENQLILTFGAAYILYDGGREVQLGILNKVKISVLLLATIGVLMSTFITGYFAYKILKIDLIYALLLGAVIASTDPSVLVPLFKNMNISNKLKQTIISESAFNDAAGAIMTFTILGIIEGGTFSVGRSAWELLVKAGGGVVIGLIVGYAATFLVGEKKHSFLTGYPGEIAVAAVLGGYIIAEHFHFSGFMAVFIIGIVCGNKDIFRLSIKGEEENIHISFKEVLIMIIRIMIFVILGTQINFAVLGRYWAQALLVIVLFIFIARPVSVIFSVILDKKAEWSFREILYLMWTRETGVIPAALVGMLASMKINNSEIISAVTFMAIIITLGVQASTAKYVAKVLKLEI